MSLKNIPKSGPPTKKFLLSCTCHSPSDGDGRDLLLPLGIGMERLWNGYGMDMELIWTFEFLPSREPNVLLLNVEEGYFGSQKKSKKWTPPTKKILLVARATLTRRTLPVMATDSLSQ
jgi:hypothetical protein